MLCDQRKVICIYHWALTEAQSASCSKSGVGNVLPVGCTNHLIQPTNATADFSKSINFFCIDVY